VQVVHFYNTVNIRVTIEDRVAIIVFVIF